MTSLVSSLNMPVRHNEHYGTVMWEAATPQSRSRPTASTCREHKKAAGHANDRRFKQGPRGPEQPRGLIWYHGFSRCYSLAAEQGLQGLHAAFLAAAHGLQAPQAAFLAAAHGLQAPQEAFLAAWHGLQEACAGTSLTTGDRTTAPAARPRTTGRAAAPDRSLDLCIFMSVFSTLGFADMAFCVLDPSATLAAYCDHCGQTRHMYFQFAVRDV